MRQAAQTGARQAAAIAAPSRSTESAMPISVGGAGTPAMASPAPTTITVGKITGRATIRGRPRNAPHSPTDTIASRWSKPDRGWRKPDANPPGSPVPLWAKAGVAKALAAQMRETVILPQVDGGCIGAVALNMSGMYPSATAVAIWSLVVRLHRFGLALAVLCCATGAAAHDFWVQPRTFNPAVGEVDPVTIEVGHGPFRSRWSGSLDRVVLFRNVAPAAKVDLKAVLHPTPDQDALLTFSTPGTQMLLFESTDALSNLPSIRYNDYAKVEGLTPALEYRARTGQTQANGRESYSRRCKALINVGAGGKPNEAITRPVGFNLEIVPAISPYALKPGQRLPVQVLYQGRPLAGALVKLTNLEFDVRPVSTQRTDASGHAQFEVPRTGDWLVNVIWTQPIKGNPNADFETTFSSLTFGYSASRRAAG